MADSPPTPQEDSPLLAAKVPIRKSDSDGKGSASATLKLICESGAGLIADGYDLSVINLVLAILEHLHPESMTPSAKGLTVSVTIVGVILGQLGFGSFADIVGRKVASLTTALLTVFGALLSAFVVDTEGGFMSLTLQLCILRFMLGLGIGGEYPLSAAIAKEVKEGSLLCTRAQLLCINTLLFNVGSLLQSCLVTCLLAANLPLDLVWRVALGAGLVPSVAAFATRWYMHEPDREEEGHVESSRGMRYMQNLAETVGPKWSILLGACLSWCLFNFVAYGQGSFSAIICDRLLGAADDTVLGKVTRESHFAIISSLFAILGSAVAVVIEGRMSRWLLQILGFTICALWNFLEAGLLDPLHNTGHWLLALFYFLGSATNSLTAVTTYLVPSESFPPASRATCVGLAAASGKLGAAVGTGLFPMAEGSLGLKFVMYFCGAVMLLGTLETIFLTPRGPPPSEDGASCKTA